VETIWLVFLGVGFGCLLAAAIMAFLRRDTSANTEVSRRLQELAAKNEAFERSMRDELSRIREAVGSSAKENREELSKSLKDVNDSLLKQIVEMTKLQNTYLEKLTMTTEDKLNQMRTTIEEKLKSLQEDNTSKLEKIRATVEEKLHDTLEKRLGESFKLVSERLEQVHKGLGEMQNLAVGVGDLKKALVNVKARGMLGEIQLENILAEIFTPEQYEKNFAVKPSSGERVEFAVKMPGRDSSPVWLPIDAKFPIEDYQRLQEGYEQGEPALLEAAAKQLENSIKKCAKDIRDKYLVPPLTTDFAIMFLPFEGLYAEVLRRAGLFESLMRDYRVAVAGPTTLAAFLSSLQMGFRTLAIERRSSEVWALLGAVKTEFGKFGVVLDKTRKKLQEASNTIDDATVRTKAIQRKLRDVEELPDSMGSAELLGVAEEAGEEDMP
jgi:DNA recombination protein RmuC